MGLTNFVYMCPFCGHDPLEEERGGGAARCSGGCGVRLRHDGRHGGVFVERGGEPARLFAASDIERSLREWEAKTLVSGPPSREARALMKRAEREAPLRYMGKLLGFYEVFGEGAPGRLRLGAERIEFVPDRTGEETFARDLSSLRSLQTSSSTIQFGLREGGVVSFKFPEDSSRRWEGLVCEALRRHYRRAGEGEIVEFQPRIRTGHRVRT
ncbi:MAG: hypothetical protein WD960_06030 [Gemmatimonadota bacterium]